MNLLGIKEKSFLPIASFPFFKRAYTVESNFSSELGFTLIELIIVILLIAIMGAVAFPLFNRNTFDVGTAAATVQTDIRMAQELAMARNQSVSIDFDVAGQYDIDDPGGTNDWTRVLPGNAVTNDVTVSFNQYGEPENGSDDYEVTVSAGGESRTITVEAYSGRVTVS